MKKTLVLLLSCIIFLSSCNGYTENQVHWEFEHSYYEVKMIKIVNAEDAYSFSTIEIIDLNLKTLLLDDIKGINMKNYHGSLSHPYGISILVEFQNGDYDIISSIEPKHCTMVNGNIIAHNSWLYCEQNDFNAILNKYYTTFS